MQSARMVWAEGEGRDVYRDMRSGGITGLHPTRSGSLYISANTAHFWQALCELIGLPQLACDERYDTVRKRAQRAQEIVPLIRGALQARSALEWEDLFGERVPCAAVRPVEDMFDHPQVLAEGMVQRFEHPLVGSYRGFARAVTFDGEQGGAARPAPTFGQHADEVLARCGYSGEEIAQLRGEGALG